MLICHVYTGTHPHKATGGWCGLESNRQRSAWTLRLVTTTVPDQHHFQHLVILVLHELNVTFASLSMTTGRPTAHKCAMQVGSSQVFLISIIFRHAQPALNQPGIAHSERWNCFIAHHSSWRGQLTNVQYSCGSSQLFLISIILRHGQPALRHPVTAAEWTWNSRSLWLTFQFSVPCKEGKQNYTLEFVAKLNQQLTWRGALQRV